MPNNEQQETTYPIYNQYIYKEGIGWVLIGGGGGGDSLPDQTNNSGKYLTTNGSAASWSAVTPASIGALPTGTTAAQIGAIPDTHVVNGITQADIDDWNSDEVFIAISGTTTYADTLAAYNAGKLIVAKTNTGKFVPLTTYNGSELRFEHLNGNQRAWIVLNSSGWSYGQQTAYVQENRTINSKALSSNITLTATDVGAIPDSAAAAGITSEDITNWNSKIDVDEKVKQTPVNGENATKVLLVGNTSSEITSAIKSVPNITYNDSSKTLKIAGTSNEKDTIFHGDSIGFRTLSNNRQGRLQTEILTADRTYTLQDASGTLAFTSDVPTSLNDLTNDPGFISSPNIPYLTCETAADTAAKITTLVSGSFGSTDLIAGAQVLVKFTNANGIANPTISINGTTAKSIKRYGTTAPGTSSASSWNAGAVVMLVYDGTYWQMEAFMNTTYSGMSDAEITAGTGTSNRLITPARLKTAIETWAMPADHAAHSITNEDIASWDAKVSDDHKWNDVALNKTSTSPNATILIPFLTAADATTANLIPAGSNANAYQIPKYDSNGYLISTTPAVHDASTKVATTDFVTTELSYIDGLPTQTNNAGKFLTTNGTTASWTSIDTLLDYKGVKSTAAQLPSSNNVTGDVWLVSEDNSEYIWNGTIWEKFGPTIDLSGYVPTSRKVNNKALSSDITLTATDVGAIPDSHVANGITSTDISNWNNKSATDEKVKAVSGLSNGSTYYPIYGGSTGNAETKYYHTAFTFKYGANAIAQLGIGKQGSPGTLAIYRGTNNSSNYGLLQASTLTANRTYDLPDATGTLALYSQIPTSLNDLTNDPGFVTDGDLSTTLANYMVKGIDYVTAGKKSGTTLGTGATAEGSSTTASANNSHAEGSYTVASGQNAHAEGHWTTASSGSDHAEGTGTTASGGPAHAEGSYTTASGQGAHAEGGSSTASGQASHAEGDHTTAAGTYAHAEGCYTLSNKKSQHVFGEYNIGETLSGATAHTVRGTYVEIVGNGTADNARSNARTLDWSGNETLAGKLTLGTGPSAAMDAATKEYVDTKATITIVDWTAA